MPLKEVWKNTSPTKFPRQYKEVNPGAIPADKQVSVGIVDNATPSGGFGVPHAPGAINYVEPGDKDVISWDFSGCIMGVYTENGKRRICHVSTADGKNCRADWNAIKARDPGALEFKPGNTMLDSRRDLLELGSPTLWCYGVIAPDNEALAIIASVDEVVLVVNVELTRDGAQ